MDKAAITWLNPDNDHAGQSAAAGYNGQTFESLFERDTARLTWQLCLRIYGRISIPATCVIKQVTNRDRSAPDNPTKQKPVDPRLTVLARQSLVWLPPSAI